MRILIVEDDPVCYEKMLAILSDFGECSVAESGEEAILFVEKAEEEDNPFDLLTLDIELPGMSGAQVLQELRRREAKRERPGANPLRVIMVTAQGDASNVMACLRSGCESFIVKPFGPERIMEALRRLWPDGHFPQEPEEKPAEAVPPAPAHPSGSWRNSNRRALVIEDDEVSREKMRALLEPLGPVDTAGTGQEALDMFRAAQAASTPYRFITVDYALPDMTGEDVLLHIRNWEADPAFSRGFAPSRIIMVTAFGNTDLVKKVIKLGCSGFLVKPFDRETIEKALDKIFPSHFSLIVDEEVEFAERLGNALVSLGPVEAFPKGREAILRYRNAAALQDFPSLVFVNADMPGTDVPVFLEAMRSIARNIPQGASPRFILTTPANKRETILQGLKTGCSAFLLKPFSEKALNDCLASMGIEVDTLPGPEAEEAGQSASAISQNLRQSVVHFLENSQDIADIDVRIRLEKQFLESGTTEEEAGEVMAELLLSQDLPMKSRLNLVRVCGYVRNPYFLAPLRKLTEEHGKFFLVKETLIAVSKFTGRGAYEILSSNLQRIQDPALIEQIGEAIARIRRDDPLLSLLPRFLNAQDPVALRSVVDTFKRILKPPDAGIFFDYLDHADPGIAAGAFEILAHAADENALRPILEHAHKQVEAFKAAGPQGFDGLNATIAHLRAYFGRFPELSSFRFVELENLFDQVADRNLRANLAGILAMGKDAETVRLVRDAFETAPSLREAIIEGMAVREDAGDFFMEKFHSEKALREPIARTLARTAWGRARAAAEFPSLDAPEQEVMARVFPFSGDEASRQLLAYVLASGPHSLKEAVLANLGVILDPGIFAMLSAPEAEAGLFALGEPFFRTAAQSCPVRLVKRILARAAGNALPPRDLEAGFALAAECARRELVLSSPAEGAFAAAMSAVVQTGSTALNLSFLELLKRAATFDERTVADMNQALQVFTQGRSSMPESEAAEVRLARENIKKIQKELESFQQYEKDAEALFARQIPDLEQAEKLLAGNRLAGAFRMESLAAQLGTQLAGAGSEKAQRLRRFLDGHPGLARAVARRGSAQAGEETAEPFRFDVLCRLSTPAVQALLADQFREEFPPVRLQFDRDPEPGEGFLICDAPYLERFLESGTNPARRLFLILDNREDFSAYQAFNPKVMIPPVSAARLFRMVVQELYTI